MQNWMNLQKSEFSIFPSLCNDATEEYGLLQSSAKIIGMGSERQKYKRQKYKFMTKNFK